MNLAKNSTRAPLVFLFAAAALFIFFASFARSLGASELFSKDIVISGADIQSRVDAMNPIVVRKHGATLTLSHPVVLLGQQANLLSVASDLDFEPPAIAAKLGAPAHVLGHAKATGSLRYEASEGAFYIDAPQVAEFQLARASEKINSIARELAQGAATHTLGAKPVFILKDDNLKQKLAKATLKKTTISNGNIVATVGF